MTSGRKNKTLIVAFLAMLNTYAFGQGTFQNLDFENGVFIPAPTPQNPFAVEWVPAMPGWTGFLGTNQQSVITSNTLALSVANISIFGPDQPQPGLFHGQYYVVLQAGLDPSDINRTVSAGISQTGTIPAGSLSVRFYSNASISLGFGVYFGINQIPMLKLGTAPNGRPIWGGDISSFSGQTGELRFQGNGYLDYIQFSSEPVPEPSTFALAGVGALLLGWRLRRNRRP